MELRGRFFHYFAGSSLIWSFMVILHHFKPAACISTGLLHAAFADQHCIISADLDSVLSIVLCSYNCFKISWKVSSADVRALAD